MMLDARDLIAGCAVAETVGALGQKVELVWIREHKFVDPPAPVLADRGCTFQDGHEIFVGEAKSADMGAGKTEVFYCGHHQCGALQPLRFLFSLQALDELIRDHAARQLARLHQPRYLRGRHIDVRQHGEVAQSLPDHVLLQLVKLAQVVPQLGDDVLRARRYFQLQFVELHHEIGFTDLEGVHNGTGKEIEGRGARGFWPQVVFQAATQGAKQPQNEHRIHIVNRLRFAGESFLLRVAGQGQDVLHTEARERVNSRFQHRAVSVFTRQMRNRCELVLKNAGDKSLRRQRGIASGKIGQADSVDSMPLGRFFHKDFSFQRTVIASQDEFGRADELALLKRQSKAVRVLAAAVCTHWYRLLLAIPLEHRYWL